VIHRIIPTGLIVAACWVAPILNQSHAASAPETSNTIEPHYEGSDTTSFRKIIGPSGSELLIGGNFSTDNNCNVTEIYDYVIAKAPRFGTICYREETARIKYDSADKAYCIGREVTVKVLYYIGNGEDHGEDDFKYSAGLPGRMSVDGIVSMTFQPPGKGSVAREAVESKKLDFDLVPKCQPTPR